MNKNIRIHNMNHYFSEILQLNLTILSNTIQKTNDDTVILVVGEPGAGKTYIASQIAKWFYIDFNYLNNSENLPIKNMFYSAKKYESYARNSKKQILIMDESYRSMSSKRSMSSVNFNFGTMLREVRSKNHVHLFIMQDMWDFEKNVVFQRADLLIYCYKLPDPKNLILKKGYFKMLGPSMIRRLYIEGWRYHNMNAIRMGIKSHYFSNNLEFDEKEYNKAKEDFIKKSYEEQKEEENLKQDNKSRMVRNLTAYYFDYLIRERSMKKEDAYSFIIERLKDDNITVAKRTMQGWIKEAREKGTIQS